MNKIIAQANKDLAKSFGICWHEFDNGEWVTVAQPCDEEKCIHCNVSNLYMSRPDFRKIFKRNCHNCNGSGESHIWRECYNCEDGLSHHDCGEDTCCCLRPEPNMKCDICQGRSGWYEPCPHCHSLGSRQITMLQINAEEDDTWKPFLWSLVQLSLINKLLVPGGEDMQYEMRAMLSITDNNSLLIKYRDWRVKHETQKA